MAGMTKDKGKIIIPAGVNVWSHELRTAKTLAEAGLTVEFVPQSTMEHQTTADVMISQEIWEFKSPKSGSIKAIERNLKRARWQSPNIVFDSQRMKKLPDIVVERELRKRYGEIKGIKRLIFIGKSRNLIDIM